MGMRGLSRSRATPFVQSLLRALTTICGIIILSGLVYWGVGWTKAVFGGMASAVLGSALVVIYLTLMRYRRAIPICRSTIRRRQRSRCRISSPPRAPGCTYCCR